MRLDGITVAHGTIGLCGRICGKVSHNLALPDESLRAAGHAHSTAGHLAARGGPCCADPGIRTRLAYSAGDASVPRPHAGLAVGAVLFRRPVDLHTSSRINSPLFGRFERRPRVE